MEPTASTPYQGCYQPASTPYQGCYQQTAEGDQRSTAAGRPQETPKECSRAERSRPGGGS